MMAQWEDRQATPSLTCRPPLSITLLWLLSIALSLVLFNMATATRTHVTRSAAQGRQLLRCTASQQKPLAAPQASRRRLLAIAPLLSVILDKEAKAAWDGESPAVGSCSLAGEEGRECRQQILLGDQKGLNSYETAKSNLNKVSRTSGSTEPANPKYASDTTALIDKLRLYTELDVYDPQRMQVIKQLKVDGAAWASKYARGGAVRTASGQKVYIAVDSVQGHLASNGLAPFPASKGRKLQQDLDDATALLAQGR